MLAFERQSQNTAPGSGRLITRRLNPHHIDRLHSNGTTTNSNTQNNTQSSHQSQLPPNPHQQSQSQHKSNLHSTPVPSSRGLQQSRHLQLNDGWNENDTPQNESDWLKLLNGSNNNTDKHTTNITQPPIPSLPKGLLDPALYSPKQFSPRRLNNGTRRAADVNGTIYSEQQQNTPHLGLSAPTLGLGNKQSSRTSANAPKWDLSKFNSPANAPRRLGMQSNSSKLGVGQGQQQAQNNDISELLAKSQLNDN